jgi:C1A family cysteine protease
MNLWLTSTLVILGSLFNFGTAKTDMQTNHRLLTASSTDVPPSGLTWEAFKEKYLISNLGKHCKFDPKDFKPSSNPSMDLPFEVNWKSMLSIPPVKDQEDCKASWIFAAVSAIEAHSSINSGEPIRLFSTQQLLDCMGSKNRMNCTAGSPGKVYDYLQRQGGLSLQYLYRNKSLKGASLESYAVCKYDVSQSGVQVGSGSKDLRPFEDDKLLQALLTQGPITVLMDGRGLKSYQTGIWDGFYTDETKNRVKCSDKPEDLNHAAMLVGVEFDEKGVQYYTILNSWGDNWGEGGYFRLKREFNICGISLCASFPRLMPY